MNPPKNQTKTPADHAAGASALAAIHDTAMKLCTTAVTHKTSAQYPFRGWGRVLINSLIQSTSITTTTTISYDADNEGVEGRHAEDSTDYSAWATSSGGESGSYDGGYGGDDDGDGSNGGSADDKDGDDDDGDDEDQDSAKDEGENNTEDEDGSDDEGYLADDEKD